MKCKTCKAHLIGLEKRGTRGTRCNRCLDRAVALARKAQAPRI
jgi:DNA-directed RNA polymerase subunit RPC12/RpoP